MGVFDAKLLSFCLSVPPESTFDKINPLAMQQSENVCEGDATAVDIQVNALPNALVAYKVPEDLCNDGRLKVRRKMFNWLMPE